MTRNVTVFFTDGSSHVYANVPDGVTPDQVSARAQSQFPGRQVRHMDGGRGKTVDAGITTAPVTAPQDKREKAGFFGSLEESIQTLGLTDEAAAFAANPTEENRRAFLKAAESKYKSVGGFGKGENWEAFKELLGSSLGQLVAPAVAATTASLATTPVGGAVVGAGTIASQYEIQALLRQAQEQEKALAEGRTPQELSIAKATAAAAGQTALDVAGFKLFRETFRAFPFLRNLVSSEKEIAEEAARKLVDAAREGTLKSTARGTVQGVAGGVAFEVPQEVAQQALERWQAGLSLSDAEAKEEFKQAAIGAAVLGPVVGGPAGALGARAERNKAQVLKAASDKAQSRLNEIGSKPDPTTEERAEAEFIQANLNNPLELAKKYKPATPATSKEEAGVKPPPVKPAVTEIKTAEDLLNSPPKVAAEDAPEPLRNEPLNLTEDQVYEEIGKIEQQMEQLATLLFSPEQIQTQATAANIPVETFTANLTKAYDDLATRLDVFDKNYIQRLDAGVSAPKATSGINMARRFTQQELAQAQVSMDVAKALNLDVIDTQPPTSPAPPAQPAPSISSEAALSGAEPTSQEVIKPPEPRPVGGGAALPPSGQESEGRVPAISPVEGVEPPAPVVSDVDGREGAVEPTLTGEQVEDERIKRVQAAQPALRGKTLEELEAEIAALDRAEQERNVRKDEVKSFAKASARQAFDTQGDYRDLEDSIDSNRENIRDTLNEGVFGKEAVDFEKEAIDAYDAEVARLRGTPKAATRTEAASRAKRPVTTDEKRVLAERIAQRLAPRGMVLNRSGPFAQSKIVVSDAFNPRIEGFLKAIVNIVGLGDTNIILLSKGDLRTPGARTVTTDKYNLYGGFNVEFLIKDSLDPTVDGAAARFSNQKGYAIVLDDRLPIQVMLETLSHEVGHIVESEAFINANEKTRTAVFDEYLAWLDKNGKEETAKLIRLTRPYSMAERGLKGLPESSLLSEKDQEYLKSFSEWFADNVAKWMTTSEKPLTVVEKFFSTLAKRIRKIVAYLTGNRPEFLPAASVKSFLDGLTPFNEDVAAPLIKEAMGIKGPRPIFPTIDGLKNFWNWFSGSKVVDEEGHPIIMYHGSPKVFSVFRPGRANAIFLSPDPNFAERFTLDAFDYDVGPMYAVYVNAKNPFDFDNWTQVAELEKALAGEFTKTGGVVGSTDWLNMMSGIKEGDWRTIEQPMVQRAIRKLGHDGFYVMESLYSPELMERVDSKNLAVYEPNQVKSAIGNNGKFSKKSNDVRQSRRVLAATINNVGRTVSNLPPFNKRVYDGVRSVLDSTRITDSMRSALYAFLSLPQKVELFIKELPTLEGLLNVLNVRASSLKDRKEVLDRHVRKWNDAIKDNLSYKDEFYEIAHESTRLIGPDGKQGIQFNNPVHANHPLTQRFNRLPPALQEVYWEMLASYRKMSDEYLALLSKNLSPREAKRLQREMATKRLRVYLPLYREGDYWLRYQDASNETVVQSFKSNYERELAWKEAVSNGAQNSSKQEFTRIEDFFKGEGAGTFFNRVLDDLNKRGVSPAVKRSLYELYLDQIPASSVRQLYRKRDGYKGYESDLMNVYATVATRMANQLTNLEFIPEIDSAFDEVKQEAKQYAESGRSKNRSVPLLIDNLNNQMEYLRDPGNGKLVNALSSFSYYWYIIGNVSTAIINTTQLPMVVYPMLAGKYGVDRASAAMADATKQYFKGGFDNDNIPGGYKKFPSDFSFGVGVPPNSPLGKLYKAAVRQSAIRRSTGYDLVEGRKKTYGKGDYIGLLTKMEQILGWTFQNSERFNREVTLIAAFNLEMEKNGGDVDGAIKAAINLVNQTHGTTLAETSPNAFQTGFGKVAFTFKNFAQTQIYLQAKLLREATKGETPEVKQLAAKQMIGIMTMAFVFAGIHGMPFYSAGTLLVDLLADLFGDEDDPVKSNEIVRQSVGALAHKGVVNELFMADVAARTGFNGLLWKDDDKRLEEVGPVLFAAEQIFGPSYAAFMGFFRAGKDYTEGHYDRALEAATPAAIRNALKARRFALEGSESRSGEKIFDDFNAYEISMQVLGFTPVETARRSEIAGALASRINDVEKRKTALLNRLYLTRINKDKEGEREVREDIKRFNQNEFVKKTRNVIGYDDMNDSFERRRRNARSSIYGINVPEKARRQLEKEYKLEEDR
jgi:hypothetical protein